MNPWIRVLSSAMFLIGVVSLVLTGCTQDAKKDPTSTKSAMHDHPDKGPHGGPLAEWGNDEIHVELTVNPASKQMIIYLLDEKAKNPPKIEIATIKEVRVSLTAPTKVENLELKHDPNLSGDKGIAFTATHEAFAKDDEFKGTIQGKVEKKRYSDNFQFKSGK